MDIDFFLSKAQAGVTNVVLHNVRLLDVKQVELPPSGDQPGAQHEVLVVDCAGVTREIPGGLTWKECNTDINLGKWGCLVQAEYRPPGAPSGICYFRPYGDQSLRRAPEMDCAEREDSTDPKALGRARAVVGWRCDDHPHGFLAPVGLIPGQHGSYVPDLTVAVTVRVPPEFVREAERVQMTPEQLLRSFVGDLAGIENFVSRPRADGYSSNGSDEHMYAQQWLDRAHAMNAIDLDEKDAREEESREWQHHRDEFADLLDDYKSLGGEPDALLQKVQEWVDAQAREKEDRPQEVPGGQ